MLKDESRKYGFRAHVPKQNVLLPFSEWKDGKEEHSDSKTEEGTEC